MKIFIVGPSWVGDMVMAQSLFITLRRLHPKAQIDVLAPAWSRPIIAAMPEVDQVIDMPLGHGVLGLRKRRVMGHALRPSQYDRAIILPNSFKSALIPWFANIPVRTGWTGESRYGILNDRRPLNSKIYPMMVQKYVALAYPKGTTPSAFECPSPSLVPDPEKVHCAMDFFDLKSNRPVLGLCPGAEFGPAKKWPERHYVEIARRYIATGGRVWLFGSANDVPACEKIASDLPPNKVHVLAGKTSLQDAVALMSKVSLVITNDSGLMHVAAGLERPLVALFGSTSPDYTPPLNKACCIIKSDISCSPCFQRECPYGHYKCLEEMAPDRVWSALQRLSVN